MSGSAICVWNAEMPTNWTVLQARCRAGVESKHVGHLNSSYGWIRRREADGTPPK